MAEIEYILTPKIVNVIKQLILASFVALHMYVGVWLPPNETNGVDDVWRPNDNVTTIWTGLRLCYQAKNTYKLSVCDLHLCGKRIKIHTFF